MIRLYRSIPLLDFAVSNLITSLQIDHRNMAGLLDVIEQQLRRLTRGEPVNYRLLDSAFAYLSGYPDRCHHPKEDLVYRKLVTRRPDLAASLKNLVAEHEQLAQLTRNLTAALAEPRQAALPGGDYLAVRLTEFLRLYRQHMLMEDQHFFAAALRWLSPDDFGEIDFALFDQPDPLLDPSAEGTFAELRGEIMRLAAREKTRSDDRQEPALLAEIRDPATFNAVMQRSGAAVRLAGSAETGYELEHNGNVLVHIPACSESCAAWCAYFYWKASTPRSATS